MRPGDIRQDTSWNNYRRALGKEDREVFDEMIGKIQTYAPALGSSAIDRLEGMILALLLAQEMEVRRLNEVIRPL
jgi:hypothetical protein